MATLTVYILLLALGLVAAVVLLLKGVQEENMPRLPPSQAKGFVSADLEAILSRERLGNSGEPDAVASAVPVSFSGADVVSLPDPQPSEDASSKLADELQERCRKLEALLDEKNRLLRDAQAQLSQHATQQSSADNVTSILQQEISLLRQENKRLREGFDQPQTGLLQPPLQVVNDSPAIPDPAFKPFKNTSEDFIRAEPDEPLSHPPAVKNKAADDEVIPASQPQTAEPPQILLRDVFDEGEKA